ncbi:MAG: hypothetical protein KatS3mg118_1433 [Paracoccaceae bacterium]|nr:MAG: hypothetical protein KatS3mg118_1433 [Paracoccaceae bacterium]
MLIGTAMVGLVWTPDGWHYSIRPTYSHEFAGLFAHLQERKGDKLRIGAVSTQTLAGFVDQVNGIKHLAETYPDRFELVDTQWVEASPVSVTSNVRALAEKEPDVLLVGGTTAQVIAVAKALQELGLDIPIVMSTHNGLAEVSKGISLSELEGSMSAFSFAAPGKAELPIRDVFEANNEGWRMGHSSPPSPRPRRSSRCASSRTAIETVGADNVTGEAMRQAPCSDGTFTEADLLGALPTVDFDTSAPFPIGKIKSTAEIVVARRDHQPLSTDWMDVPALERWLRRCLLSLSNVDVVYGGVIQVLRSTNIQVPRGPDGGAARRQRRRQDHDAQGDLRPAPRRSGRRHRRAHRLRRRGHHRCRSHEIFRGDRPGPRRAARVLEHLTVRAEPDGGRASAARPGGCAPISNGSSRYFPRLRALLSRTAGYLSGGEMQMLLIGRALMARPRLLILDEPSMGLAPILVEQLFDTIGRIRPEERLTVLMVEQNARAAIARVRLRLCHGRRAHRAARPRAPS